MNGPEFKEIAYSISTLIYKLGASMSIPPFVQVCQVFVKSSLRVLSDFVKAVKSASNNEIVPEVDSTRVASKRQ